MIGGAHSRWGWAPRAAWALALASALCGQQQESDPDWQIDVEMACTSPRYGVRLAVSKRIAAGGDAAVPAVRAFARAHGDNALPVALVEAIANGGGRGEAVLALLVEWAQDREFFWRGQAMKGLVQRIDADGWRRFCQVFDAHADDPAWLVRAHARAGIHAIWRLDAHDPNTATPPAWTEADPRARTRLAALTADDQSVVEALGDGRTFLGDPWGRRRATEAFQTLKKRHGKDWGYRPEADFAANAAAIAAIAREFGTPMPERLVDPALAFTGGIEILSCKNGDLFLRWTKDGGLSIGTTPVHESLLALDPVRWQALSAAATALALPVQSGVVICDKMRIQFAPDRPQVAVAPQAFPRDATDWLKQLAAAIEEAGQPILATALRERLAQFAAP